MACATRPSATSRGWHVRRSGQSRRCSRSPRAHSAPADAPHAAFTGEAIDTRTLSRSLFLRLATLTPDSPERTYVRDTLIELNLPLVRYAAARFRSRNEPMEDIVQVGTIGLIKAIDRFDSRARGGVPDLRDADRRRRDQALLPRHLAGRCGCRAACRSCGWRSPRPATSCPSGWTARPTVAELAVCLGVSEEDVVDGLAVGNAYTASSLDSPPPEDDGGEGTAGRPPRLRGHRPGGRRVPRVAQAAAGQAAARASAGSSCCASSPT